MNLDAALEVLSREPNAPLDIAELALVGSINWYDYSWSLEKLRECYPDELHRLESKRFTRGRHNDANFVRWPLDDVRFTASAVAVSRAACASANAFSESARCVASSC